MKFALGQIRVTPNQPGRNLERILRAIESAKAQGVDLIAFPEMSVNGYLVGDKWTIDAYAKDIMSYSEDIRRASQGIAVAFGNIFVDDRINERVGDTNPHLNHDGRSRKYNAAYVFQNGKPARRAKETRLLPQGVQPKTLLPTYRMFDDWRLFFSLKDHAEDFNVPLEELVHPFIIDTKDGPMKVGFQLCEDGWMDDYRRNGKPINIAKMLVQNGAEIIFNLSSSPWTYGKNGARDRQLKRVLQDCDSNAILAYVNAVGVQNNGKNMVTFDGGSTIYNAQGDPIVFSKTPYEEELIIFDTKDGAASGKIRVQEKPAIAEKLEAIVQAVRGIREISGRKEHPKFVLGLSGGIDSAVTAAILTLAVGAKNVTAINMPTQYNSAKTKGAAAYVAKQLGIAYETIPVGELVELNAQLLRQYDSAAAPLDALKLNDENIQAKIRGTNILSNYAQRHGAMFTNNGNKLEVALGYATLYGDVNGAVSLLGDLSKREVVALAKYLNTLFGKEVVPESVIPDELFRFRGDQIQPSAELKDAQIDPMKFGYHCAIIEAMTDYRKKSIEDFAQWYVEGTLHTHLGIPVELMERWDVTNPQEFIKDIEWFERQVQWAVFKRIQSPPIVITSKSAYGYDLRESQLSPHVPHIPEMVDRDALLNEKLPRELEFSRTYLQLREKVERMKKYVPRKGGL